MQNCREVNIKGKVTEVVSKEGIQGVMLTIKQPASMGEFFVQNRLIEHTKTDSLGFYDITFEVDSAQLNFGIVVAISKVSDEYIFDSFLPNSEYCHNVKDTIDFSLYRKANLNLKITKTSNEPYHGLDVSVSKSNGKYSLKAIPNNFKNGQDTTYNLTTTAGVFTIINWKKYTNKDKSTFEKKTDSLFCKSGQTNIFNLIF